MGDDAAIGRGLRGSDGARETDVSVADALSVWGFATDIMAGDHGDQGSYHYMPRAANLKDAGFVLYISSSPRRSTVECRGERGTKPPWEEQYVSWQEQQYCRPGMQLLTRVFFSQKEHAV